MTNIKLQIKKATKAQSRLRLAIAGPSGSGKTLTAIKVAEYIAKQMGKRVLVVDTERGSASKYSDLSDFDVCELNETHHPGAYIEALKLAVEAGVYGVVILDSLSHAWVGKDGALALVDNAAKRSQGNSYTAWRDVTPLHNALVDAILMCPVHIIATLRSKTEYILEVNERGKSVPRKVGLAPVQRDGMEYEFDVFGEMNHNHDLSITKSRCFALADAVINKPNGNLGKVLYEWVSDGTPMQDPPAQPEPQPQPAPAPKSAPTFEEVVDAERQRLGNDAFASVLKIFGCTPETLPTDREKRIEIYNALRSAQVAR